MKHLDWTLPTPEQNLAADEALLEACEAQPDAEVLRFWMPRQHFVVLGYANDVATEVNVAACAARGVPILRRCSGGGTVLQGPGCLNYSLVLRIRERGPTRSIRATNQFVLERNAAALKSAIGNPQSAIAVCGPTDLTLNGLKFSGNAQRRKRRCVLFHGTFLLDLDLALVEALLPLPSRQPDYRQNRAHRNFLRHLPLPADAVKQALRAAWQAQAPWTTPLEAVIEVLVAQKYGREELGSDKLPGPRHSSPQEPP
jgi:lipoate-protein ligase A